MATNCLFCRIRDGELPAKKIFEDDRTIAFEDVNPQAPRHFLVIPKEHLPTLDALQAKDEALVGHLVTVAAELARRLGVAEGGYRAVFNCNADAGQTVFHIHLHLLGGREMGWPPG